VQPTDVSRARLLYREAARAGVNALFDELCAWPHILQSRAWAEFKSRWGWSMVNSLAPSPISQNGREAGGGGASISILSRHVSRLPFPIFYAPKGPNVSWLDPPTREQTLTQLEQLARAQRAILVKIDPDVSVEHGEITDELTKRGWVFSSDQIQYRNTMLLNMRQSEDELLAAMKPKWRYNIRVAERKDVEVRTVDGGRQTTGDSAPTLLKAFYDLYAETSARDNFLIRPFEYYKDVWSHFLQDGLASLFLAYHQDKLIAGIMLFVCDRRAWYFYGASSSEQRELMPNHLLQWRAIQWAKENGCEVYDFWGAPNELNESDPMWGVYRFKEGFGAELFRGIGAWDYAPSRARYQLYTQVMPRVIALMRRRHAQAAHETGG
ncbi:MAG: peptidoglycan bridge formation glycyltransferase FemA/FemB family protein, partial [Chloroflexi bacterium]|nr:peptidoglycan bridge formation glycyltransferase FemA/FemB family protein [Chloroflexota bacterium]